jgi:hypothetical protein
MIPVLLLAAKEASVLDQGGVDHVYKTLINAMVSETDTTMLSLLLVTSITHGCRTDTT